MAHVIFEQEGHPPELEAAFPDLADAAPVPEHHGWLSVVPPLLAIGLALAVLFLFSANVMAACDGIKLNKKGAINGGRDVGVIIERGKTE